MAGFALRGSLLKRLTRPVTVVTAACTRPGPRDGHHGFTWAPGARRFATWEHSYVNVLGLGAAVRQALELGPEPIGQRAAVCLDAHPRQAERLCRRLDARRNHSTVSLAV